MKDFEVEFNYVEIRYADSSIPKPFIEILNNHRFH